MYIKASIYIYICILKCCLHSTNVRLFTNDIAPDVFSLYEYKKKERYIYMTRTYAK